MRRKFLLIGLITTVLGFISKLSREALKEVFGLYKLFGSLPSFLYIIGLLFLFFALVGVNELRKGINIIIFGTLGSLFYEFEQRYTDMVFDYGDVIATIFGAIIVYLIFRGMVKSDKLINEKKAQDNLSH